MQKFSNAKNSLKYCCYQKNFRVLTPPQKKTHNLVFRFSGQLSSLWGTFFYRLSQFLGFKVFYSVNVTKKYGAPVRLVNVDLKKKKSYWLGHLTMIQWVLCGFSTFCVFGPHSWPSQALLSELSLLPQSVGRIFLTCSKQCLEDITDLWCLSEKSVEYASWMIVSTGQWNLANIGGQVRRNLSSVSKQFLVKVRESPKDWSKNVWSKDSF